MRRELKEGHRLRTQVFQRLSRAAKEAASAGLRPADPLGILQRVRPLLVETTKPQQNRPQPTATPDDLKATTLI